MAGGRQRPAYLIRSAPGWRPRPDGESAGTAGPSGGCSGRGDGKGGASSADGAGGCMVGGAQDAFRPAEEPLRATHDVSMTLTPMLARDRETPGLAARAPGAGVPTPTKRPAAQPEHLLDQGSEAAASRAPRTEVLEHPGGSRRGSHQRPGHRWP